LKHGSDLLDDLNNSYRSIAERQHINTTSYYEKHKTGKLAFVVQKNDADCGLCVPLPIAANHLEICKPLNRSTSIYLGVRRRLRAMESVAGIASDPPNNRKIDRDVELARDLVKTSTTLWLEEKAGQADATIIASKIGEGIFGALSAVRKKKLGGAWTGMARQNVGPDGVPIEYHVSLNIEWSGDRVLGTYRFTWGKGGVTLVDEALPVEGGFYDGFLLLNFQDKISGKLQFGSLYLQLSDDGCELSGRDVGVGYKTRKIVTGDVLLRRAS